MSGSKNREKREKNYQKIPEKSNSCFLTSENSFRIFRGSFDNLSAFFRIKTQLFSPISPNILNKNIRKIIKRSSQIANFIFFYKNPEFGGSFGIFYPTFIPKLYKFIKSSSKIAFIVSVIAIFRFSEDHFLSFRHFLMCTLSKKTSDFAAFFIRRL
jgi:hypothetical protein